MSDYINKAQAVAQTIAEIESLDLEVGRELEQRIKNDYISQPPADVVEVRHGKWSHDYIKDGMEYNDWFNLHCSVCGETQREAWGKWKYCPYCGAKMDGEEQEHE